MTKPPHCQHYQNIPSLHLHFDVTRVYITFCLVCVCGGGGVCMGVFFWGGGGLCRSCSCIASIEFAILITTILWWCRLIFEFFFPPSQPWMLLSERYSEDENCTRIELLHAFLFCIQHALHFRFIATDASMWVNLYSPWKWKEISLVVVSKSLLASCICMDIALAWYY